MIYRLIQSLPRLIDNMKALIRDDEIIPEPWDQWTESHLEWLITPRPNGDGYKLVEDYQPPEISEETS